MPVTCDACGFPMAGDEATNTEGYCDYCHDFMIGGESHGDIIGSIADRLQDIQRSFKTFETNGGETRFVTEDEEVSADLVRMAYVLRFLAHEAETP